MKHLNRIIWMAAIAVVAAAASACSVKEDPINEQTPVPDSKVVTLVATLEPQNSPDTRSVMTDNGTTVSTTWEVGDKIWVNYDDTGDNNCVAKGTVTSIDGTGKATITVDLVDPKDASIIVFGYPYNHWTEAKDVRVDQLGTLDDINQNHASITGSGTLTVVGSVATLPDNVSMNQEMAIWKLNFTDGVSDITNQITSLNINFGPSDDYMITPNAQSDIYVALYPVDGGSITITAATPTGNLSYSKVGVSLDDGKFYRSTVTLFPAAANNTYRVFTSRTNYSDVAIPYGATIVGDSGAASWSEGTYVVNSDVTIDGGVTLAGNVNLILCDDAELTIINGHIECPQDEGNTWDYLYSMNIYGQALGTGKLTVIHNNINIQTHNLGIHGGIINVTDGGVMQGIESDGTLNIYHGTINASCGANGIISMGTANIYGGTITATSTGSYGAAILAPSGDLTISGGTITATNTGSCAGIEIASGNLTITGGTVTAQGGNNSEGIISYGNITISGGNVTARAGENGIGLEGTITISGGEVVAVGGNAHADTDGNGMAGIDGTLTVTGGVITATGGAKDGSGNDGLGISDGSTITLTSVTMYEGDAANPATPAASQSACTKRYVKIQ